MKGQPSRIVALWCWYHGAAFRGYQSQRVGPTVQDTIIKAFREVGIDRNPVAAGRTDLGVHARMQVLSMRVPHDQGSDTLAGRVNGALHSGDVGIAVARDAPPKFHAQWASNGKDYRYRLLMKDDAAWAPYAWRVDVEPQAVAQRLSLAVGTHDFIAFHEKSSAQRPRTIREVTLKELAPHVFELCIVGDGFARYMVRYLVGGAVGVARGELAAGDFESGVLQAKAFAGVRAPPQGLVLWEVRYPEPMNPFTQSDRQGPALLPAGPPYFL